MKPDLNKPLAKVTVSDMVFTEITMDLESPMKCNFCGKLKKSGGMISYIPLLEDDDENKIYIYMCSKTCHTKFKKTKDINMQIRSLMLTAVSRMRLAQDVDNH